MVKTSDPAQRKGFGAVLNPLPGSPEPVQQALQHPGALAEPPRQGWQFGRYAAAGGRFFGFVHH